MVKIVVPSSPLVALCLAVAVAVAWTPGAAAGDKGVRGKRKKTRRKNDIDMGKSSFNRVATYNVCEQLDPKCNDETETVAEIVDATDDGLTLVYTDGARNAAGFVDISDVSNPVGMGVVDVGGEPTSVAVAGPYALVAVNTSPSFVEPSGKLVVIEIASMKVLKELDLGGQPDSIAISPDRTYAAIAIENERDEDLEEVDGRPPQEPAGYLKILRMPKEVDVDQWTLSEVDLTGYSSWLYPTDPEPEFVAINEENVCVVTLQENNGIALVDLATEMVIRDYSAGSVDLAQIDTIEDSIIMPTGSQIGRLREPDGATWIGTEYFATANEGDLDGGSRGFTIFDVYGDVVYDSGNLLDLLTIQHGHYPDDRSENKGNEPEGILYARYGKEHYLFVTSERGSIIFVFDVEKVTEPKFKQILPSSKAPEGLLAIPSRNIFVAACEDDDREAKFRAGIVLYEKQDADPTYPTMVSEDRADGTPIPFSALSALVAMDDETLFTVEDSYFKKSRILKLDVSDFPARVIAERRIRDTNGVLTSVLQGTEFTGIVNDDMTVNLDLEGISLAKDGGFWLVHEGAGTAGEESRPVTSPNVLFKVSRKAVIEKVILLPDDVNAKQVRFGFEGVAEDGDHVIITIQRAWTGDVNPRLAVWNQVTSTWKFYFYPLDDPESQNGGWVGLSEVSALGNGKFLVVERDNQGGPDAAIKKIYKIDLRDYTLPEDSTVTKTLVRDLVEDLAKPNGNIYEKIEGLAVTPCGHVWVVNDNDGVDDNSGEQQLINLGKLFPTNKGRDNGNYCKNLEVEESKSEEDEDEDED